MIDISSRFSRVLKFILSPLLVLILNVSFAQLGGSYTYQYLQLPVGARTAALGGLNISTFDDDPRLAWYNPALLNEGMHNVLSVNHSVRAGNINHGYVTYARSMNESVNYYGGLLYNSYGQIPAYDENGIQTGSFNASEYALNAGIAYRADLLSYGVNTKLLYSQLESYNSLGVAIDIGAAYIDTASKLYAGLVLKNIGIPLIYYTPDNREELPFEIQVGVSKRLKYLPLQVSLTGHNLQRFDIRYDDPNARDNQNIFQSDTTGDSEKKYIGDKILRHVILAGEFYFGDHFNVRLGYDFMQRAELILNTKRGLTGFSFGAGFGIKRCTIDYAYEVTSLAGGNHYFSISTDLDSFLKY